MRRGTALNPANEPARILLILCCLRSGREDRARNELQTLLALESQEGAGAVGLVYRGDDALGGKRALNLSPFIKGRVPQPLLFSGGSQNRAVLRTAAKQGNYNWAAPKLHKASGSSG